MQPELPKASKPLIIIVDDDTSLLRLLRSILGASGFRVLMANNGDHALRICSRFHRPIDAIITDVEMPGISGFTLAAEVSARRPLMPVLFMSGSVAGRRLGGRSYHACRLCLHGEAVHSGRTTFEVEGPHRSGAARLTLLPTL